MKRFRLIWSLRAANDLRQIKKFISYDKPVAAIKFLEKLKKEVERLKNFPNSGRMVPEISRKEIRELIHKKYRIIYKIDRKSVEILTVFEGHRTLKLFH